MSDTEKNAEPVEAQVAPQPIPTAMATSSNSDGMGLRLGIILGCFLIAVMGIGGFYYYINSDLPTRANDIERPAIDENTDMGDSSGAMPQAPGA